ncbi:uncharacterized protein Dvir_GJ26118 [Drosophila virilis]|uniref:Uncharacterized protein n=1 Tax=Drosophila virilis TaxID=7244 RepID=A0A0Q9WQM4_DROVI|nr:uncharacterized protein Dvir_GJ26118 [Drosophila virilis]
MDIRIEIKVKRHFVCPGTTRRIRGLLTRRLATRRVAKQTRGTYNLLEQTISDNLFSFLRQG